MVDKWLFPTIQDEPQQTDVPSIEPPTAPINNIGTAIIVPLRRSVSSAPDHDTPQPNTVQTSESTGEMESDITPFVNLDTLGIGDSGRKGKPSTALKESDPTSKEVGNFRRIYGMIVIALAAFD